MRKFAFCIRVAPLWGVKMASTKIALPIWPDLAPKMALAKGDQGSNGARVGLGQKMTKKQKLSDGIVENLR